MGVLDGQSVSAAVTNPAFINKNINDQMPNVLGLTNTFSPTISDIQAAANRLYTATGVSEISSGTNYNATSGTITNGQSYQTALGILANKFDAMTGHLHSGNPGDGPLLNVVRGIAVTGGAPQTGEVILVGTGGLTVTPATGGVFIFNGAGGGSGSGVSSIAVSGSTALTGAVLLQQGNGVQLTQSGQDILIAASGFAGGAVTPTTQIFLSGSGTYNLPAGVIYIEVEMVGAGAGGSGSAIATMVGGIGGIGGTTSFGTSLLTATGGTPSNPTSGIMGVGGTGTVNSPAIQIINVSGAGGNQGAINSGAPGSLGGVIGGSSFFGGAGSAPDAILQPGGSASANSGSGGAGAGAPNVSGYSGVSGASGAYVKARITSPSSTYSYTVGAAGTAGTAGSGGAAGGSGGSGVIIVTEYYANGAIGTATTITGNLPSSQVTGTTAGGNAATGFIGEFISNNSSGVSVGSTGAYVTIASISLAAGDWDVEGQVQLATGATTAATEFTGALSLNATSLDSSANGGITQFFNSLVVSATYSNPIGKRRFNLTSTTTIFLVGQMTYTVAGGATWNINNLIRARRVR